MDEIEQCLIESKTQIYCNDYIMIQTDFVIANLNFKERFQDFNGLDF